MIYTIPDLLNAIAAALDQEDPGALDLAESAVREWLQPEREREAQLNLIASVRNAIERTA